MLVCAMGHLDIERNASVRAFVEKRIADHYEGSRSAYAKAAKLSPSVVSELLNGGRGAGLRVVDRIAAEAGVSPDVVTGRASNDDASAPPNSNAGGVFGTAWGACEGWVESEAEVRALTIALAIERADVAAAVRAHGRAGAVKALAKVHRFVPWWEIRARVAIVEACKSW